MKCHLINPNYYANYVNELLKIRGVKDIEEFMDPGPEALQSCHDLKNIGMAAAIYLRVVMKPAPYSRILLIVDSDNDGYTSAAIIYQYTKRINCHCKIDYWLHEGKQHGLQDHIDKLMDSGVNYDLIILPDSSSNDAHYHDMLDDIHIPCLILDHHITDTALSDNAVVVNNQLSPAYHNKELTGAGVVYQFCRFLDEKLHQNWADDYLDLAAWGIIGDMGSVLELENRYIIKQGLSHIKSPLFKYILEKQAYSITGTISASWSDILAKTNPISVAFYVVPMINALIRVGTMEEKELLFQAFIDGDSLVPCNKRGAKGTMERACVEAARVATNAKTHQNKMKEDAVARLEAKIFKYDLLENKILFVRLEDDDKFPPELNGLVAMQLAAKYKKPTIVARLNDEGFDRGSARGLNDSELRDFRSFLLSTGMFEYAQGHANAFGISIPDRKLREFHEFANQALKNIDFGENVYCVNFERSAMQTDIPALVFAIAAAGGIWGQGNAEPSIHITHIPVTNSSMRVMGANNDTLKIECGQVAYMKFHAKELIEELQAANGTVELEIVGRANVNEWGGRKTPQIFIDDYEVHQFKSLNTDDITSAAIHADEFYGMYGVI